MYYIAVGVGGMMGALLRYMLGLTVDEVSEGAFPLATWLANMSGSFALACITTYIFKLGVLHPRLTAAIGTGVIGSFTTFSTFSMEMVQLLQTSHFGTAFAYAACSLFGGLIAALIGFRTGSSLFRGRTANG